MVGVEDEGDVERAGRGFRGLDAVEHPEKIAGVIERAVGRNNFLSFAEAVVNGHDHGDLGGEVVGLAHVGVVGVVFLVGVVKAERRHGSSQHFHGRGGGREAAQHIDDALVEDAGEGELGLKFAQVELVGQDGHSRADRCVSSKVEFSASS